MSHELKSIEEIKLWILRKLGAPTIKVELTNDQLNDAVEDARRWFAAKKGEKRTMVMDTQANVNEYTLHEDIDTVLDVTPHANKLDFSLLMSPFYFTDDTQIPYQVYGAPMSGGLYSTLVQALQTVKTAKRIIGAEFEWRQDGRKLTVFPAAQAAGSLLLWYKSNHFTVEQLNERDHDLVKRYSLAKAKETLGQIRSKYPSLPTAQGQTSLNGEMLLAQAEKELLALDEEISGSAFPMGILLG